jgi:hypothetical protein
MYTHKRIWKVDKIIPPKVHNSSITESEDIEVVEMLDEQ